jgi:hypothetical protein
MKVNPLLLTAVAAASVTPVAAQGNTGCTALKRREGVRQLVQAFISGTDEDINKVPLADNVVTYLCVFMLLHLLSRGINMTQANS